MARKTHYTLTERQADGLGRLLARDRLTGGGPQSGVQLPRAPVCRGYVAKSTSSITALVGLTPGSGTVNLYRLDATTGTLVTLNDDSGAAISFTVRNMVTTAVDSATWLFISEDVFGTLWVTVENCE
jgi:hypothetical protein